MDRVVVRYGALGTKSRTVRRRMEEQLCSNLRAGMASRGIDGSVERSQGRILVHAADADGAADLAAELPGVVSASPARAVEPDEAEIVDALVALARDRTVDTYAVRAARARDDHPFTSPELERAGGAAIGEVVDADVDLEDPDVTFEADVRPTVAFVFEERRDGPGGLPVGTQAPLVALISGGIDSPVAAYAAMRRGSPVVPVYVDLGDYGGVDHRARALAACERIAARAPAHDCRPYVVDGGETVAYLAERVDRGRMLSLRRYFFAVAAAVADAEDASGVVTGEVLGQKSSQTARNLAVTSAAIDLPIHRPLFSADKPQITERARELGTYEEAEIHAGCNRLVPERPETEGRLEGLSSVEPDDLFERAAADAGEATRVDL